MPAAPGCHTHHANRSLCEHNLTVCAPGCVVGPCASTATTAVLTNSLRGPKLFTGCWLLCTAVYDLSFELYTKTAFIL